MASKKKIAIGFGVGCASVLIVCGLFVASMISRSISEFHTYQQEHADAAKTVAEIARPIIEWNDSPESATRARAEDAKPATFDPIPEIAALANEYLADKGLRRGFGPRPLSISKIFLPAEDFPDEGTTGTVPCRAALRKRVAEEIAQDAAATAHFAKRFERNTSNSLAVFFGRKPELVDRAQRVLTRDDLRWPDPVRMEPFTRNLSAFDYPAELGLLRASLGGDGERSRKIFINMLRATVVNELGGYTRPDRQRMFFRGLEPYLLMTAETNWLGSDAMFKEAAELLAGFKLDDEQAAALRAMRVIGMRQSLYEPSGGNGAHRALQKVAGVVGWAFVSPIAQGWADGDREVYEAGRDRVAVVGKVVQLMTNSPASGGLDTVYFPYRFSAFTGENGINFYLEKLQVIVALARYRLAAGRYPDSIDDLVPRYLDRAILQERQGGWGVTLLPAGTYPAAWYLPEGPGKAMYEKRLDDYAKLYGRLPRSADELRKVGANDDETSKARSSFNQVEPRPIVFWVEREFLDRAYLGNRMKYSRDRKNMADLLNRMKPEQDRIAVLTVTAYWPQPESYWDEVKERIRKQASAAPGR